MNHPLRVKFLPSLAIVAALAMQTAGQAAPDTATTPERRMDEQIAQNQVPTITTPSGLKYQDFAVGDGDQPRPGQTVVVHYTGWLTDGTKFDSSVDRGQPFTFRLGAGQVIKGWDEGVASMRINGKRRLIVPAQLGYGSRGAAGVIPPNATLIFDVQLLGTQ